MERPRSSKTNDDHAINKPTTTSATMRTPNEDQIYKIFIKHGYDRMYYGVHGGERNPNESVLYLTVKEAQDYADRLNCNKKEKINEPGSDGKGITSSREMA